MTGTAQTIVTFLFNQDKNKVFDLNKHKEKRSLNANGYLWILCEKIAKELSKDGVMTTKEQAEKYKITFGKHAGKTIKEIVETEKDYANWLYANGDETIKKCLNFMLEDK